MCNSHLQSYKAHVFYQPLQRRVRPYFPSRLSAHLRRAASAILALCSGLFGEGTNYVPSAADFDTINFVGKKLTGFTYTTLEFNNFSLQGAVEHITSDLANQVALAEDRTFIMGSTAGSLAPSYSLIGNAGTNIASTGADSVSIAADLAQIKSALQTKFVNISRGVVFGSPNK